MLPATSCDPHSARGQTRFPKVLENQRTPPPLCGALVLETEFAVGSHGANASEVGSR